MKELILLGGLAAIAAFGYYIMSRLDGFLNAVQKETERQEEPAYLSVAISSLDAVPEVLRVLKDISGRYPDVRCRVSIGQEEEVVRALHTGSADVAVLPAEAASGIQAQWECISIDSQPLFLDHGLVEMKPMQKAPQLQKILWKNKNDYFLISEFLHQLCGQSLQSMAIMHLFEKITAVDPD